MKIKPPLSLKSELSAAMALWIAIQSAEANMKIAVIKNTLMSVHHIKNDHVRFETQMPFSQYYSTLKRFIRARVVRQCNNNCLNGYNWRTYIKYDIKNVFFSTHHNIIHDMIHFNPLVKLKGAICSFREDIITRVCVITSLMLWLSEFEFPLQKLHIGPLNGRGLYFSVSGLAVPDSVYIYKKEKENRS